MSGLLALLDDVAGIAKVAAASLDDVAGQAAKAGAKTAGALIDDAAVTPKYLHGFEASRELPVIWKITKGSFRNKLVFLLPVALLLSSFAPWLISPLLMLGGAYLSYEGAEKIWHALAPHDAAHTASSVDPPDDPSHLEERKAAGAIKTDFVLSAEIMTIALSALPDNTIWMEAAALTLIGVGITIVVYGSVALIVKADDVGLFLSRKGRLRMTRAVGRGLVRVMPGFLRLLTVVGTAAMLWVGGSIVTHGLDALGWPWLGDRVHEVASAVAHRGPAPMESGLEWTVSAALHGVFALALGFVLLPLAMRVIMPLWRMVFPGR